MVNFKEKNSQFTLIITTAKQTIQVNLKYIGRKLSRYEELQTFSAIALDALRRYLLNKPIIASNVWLDILD